MSPPHFNGSDYEPEHDWQRLTTQHERVRDCALLWPGQWFTMMELAERTGEPPGSVERQVRYLRADRFGGYTVEKRTRGNRDSGLYEYRVIPPKPPVQSHLWDPR